MGDGEAVELSCHLVPVTEVTPDGKAALEERDSHVAQALLLKEHAEPVHHLGQYRAGLIGG